MASIGKSRAMAEFVEAIGDAAELLDDSAIGPAESNLVDSESLPSLLEQCDALCRESALEDAEPVRTIHHFACTGGTLIAKCIATMPNTQLLSEIDPLSTMKSGGKKPGFSPTDILYLLSYSARPVDQETIIKVFLAGISALYEQLKLKGEHLVIRDHTHSHFCTEQFHTERPTVHKMLSEKFSLASVVTVRHPLDSFISLKKNGWIHFTPPTFEEYCLRYHAFLDEYADQEVIRYEDLIENPEATVRRICNVLALPYFDTFKDTFSAIRLTGDSGRKGTVINSRSRQEVPPALQREVEISEQYPRLCQRIDYEA